MDKCGAVCVRLIGVMNDVRLQIFYFFKSIIHAMAHRCCGALYKISIDKLAE